MKDEFLYTASANRVVVFDLLDRLRIAWHEILNSYPSALNPESVSYLDAVMAAHNFHKMAVQHVISETQMSPEMTEEFLINMRDTFSRALDTLIEKL